MWIDWTGVIIPILGIIAGCFFSYYLWIINTNHQRKKIAITIKNDLLEVDERIRPLANQELIQQAKSASGESIQFHLPFFEKDDLYKTLRTEISVFDNPLAEKINDFYKKLTAAEQYRKLFVGGKSTNVDDDLYNSLAPLGDLVHKEIIPMLDVEIKWSILVPHGNKPRSQLGQTLLSLGKVTAAFCIILLVVIGVSTFISGSNENSGYSYSSINSNSYVYPTFTQTPTPTQPSEIKLSLGQTATSSEMQITVYSVQKIAPNSDYDIKKGYLCVIADVEVKNIGSKEKQFSPFHIRDSEAHMYSYGCSEVEVENELNSGEWIHPNEHRRGNIHLGVPSTAKDLILFSNIPGDNSNQRVSWTIPN